jgi:hypothetical protein
MARKQDGLAARLSLGDIDMSREPLLALPRAHQQAPHVKARLHAGGIDFDANIDAFRSFQRGQLRRHRELGRLERRPVAVDVTEVGYG